jgi:hypothetical protein
MPKPAVPQITYPKGSMTVKEAVWFEDGVKAAHDLGYAAGLAGSSSVSLPPLNVYETTDAAKLASMQADIVKVAQAAYAAGTADREPTA